MRKINKRLRPARLTRKQRMIRRQQKMLTAFRKFHRVAMDVELEPVDSEGMPEGKICYFDSPKESSDNS